MARAKNTARAEARRRNRQARTLVTTETDELTPGATEAVPQAPPRRRFGLPDVRGDLRALPRMLLTRKRLWIPFAMVIAAFIIGMLGNRNALPDGLIEPAAVYVQLVLPTQSLIAFFLAGFLAQRGSYLVGLILGVMTGPLYAIWYWEAFGAQIAADLATQGTIIAFEQFVVQATIQGALFGMLAAGFASWYRGFLKASQERGRQNRIAREQRAIEKRKEAEREARRSSTARRTTTP